MFLRRLKSFVSCILFIKILFKFQFRWKSIKNIFIIFNNILINGICGDYVNIAISVTDFKPGNNKTKLPYHAINTNQNVFAQVSINKIQPKKNCLHSWNKTSFKLSLY